MFTFVQIYSLYSFEAPLWGLFWNNGLPNTTRKKQDETLTRHNENQHDIQRKKNGDNLTQCKCFPLLLIENVFNQCKNSQMLIQFKPNLKKSFFFKSGHYYPYSNLVYSFHLFCVFVNIFPFVKRFFKRNIKKL